MVTLQHQGLGGLLLPERWPCGAAALLAMPILHQILTPLRVSSRTTPQASGVSAICGTNAAQSIHLEYSCAPMVTISSVVGINVHAVSAFGAQRQLVWGVIAVRLALQRLVQHTTTGARDFINGLFEILCVLATYAVILTLDATEDAALIVFVLCAEQLGDSNMYKAPQFDNELSTGVFSILLLICHLATASACTLRYLDT